MRIPFLKTFLVVFIVSLVSATAHLNVEDYFSSMRATGEETTAAGLNIAGLSAETAARISATSFKIMSFMTVVPWRLGQYAAGKYGLSEQLNVRFASN